MMNTGWVKLYRAILTDEKVRSLCPSRRWAFVVYLLIAQHEGRWRGYLTNKTGKPLTCKERAASCGLEAKSAVSRADKAMLDLGLLEVTGGGRLRIRNYNRYQVGASQAVASEQQNGPESVAPEQRGVASEQQSVAPEQQSVAPEQQSVAPEQRVLQRSSTITPPLKNKEEEEEEGTRAREDDKKPAATGAEDSAGDPWLDLAKEFVRYNPAQNQYGGVGGNARTLRRDWDGIRTPGELAERIGELARRGTRGRTSRQLFDEVDVGPYYKTVDEVMAENAAYAAAREEELRREAAGPAN